jgi:hypothetical protein
MTYTDITKLENCPECGANWVDKLIPQQYWENYSPPYFYSRVIGVELIPTRSKPTWCSWTGKLGSGSYEDCDLCHGNPDDWQRGHRAAVLQPLLLGVAGR